MFYTNLEKICKQKNTTPTAVVKKLGLSTSKVTAWKNGSVPKQEVMKLLADCLDTTVNSFFVDESAAADDSNDITFDDFTYAMYNETKELTENDKEMLLDMAKMLHNRIKENKVKVV